MAAPNTEPQLSPEEEQRRYLNEATENVKKNAFYMKRALDGGHMREALKIASNMIGELRTSRLSPQNYYHLYMAVTDELRDLEMFFEEEDSRASQGAEDAYSVVQLYETVQHAGNILPRLYLLITVAAVYIRSKRAPAKDILFDLVELSRGVQHPMRGLFLRNYLSQMAKDKLPDTGSEYEGIGGTVKDSIEFILQNFAEQNKLWVRMQHQGAVRDRAKREKERQNLRQLVGTNLVRLSELSGVDLQVYGEIVLPRLLEQVVNCKDVIAQDYLMECIIQVFPDEFHLHTLDTFLKTVEQLQEAVNIKSIVVSMMNRLANYAKECPESFHNQPPLFPVFLQYSSQAIQKNTKISLSDILELQVALVNFATKASQPLGLSLEQQMTHVDNVLEFTTQVLKQFLSNNKHLDSKCVSLVVELLSLPLSALGLYTLNLQHYPSLLAMLELSERKQVACATIRALLKLKQPLDSVEKVDSCFRFISPLVRDEDNKAKSALQDDDDSKSDRYELEQEQTLVARLLSLLQAPDRDTDLQFALLYKAHQYLGQGGVRRIEFTLPPLIYLALQLVKKTYQREKELKERAEKLSPEEQQELAANEPPLTVRSKKIFQFIHHTVTSLVAVPSLAELSLRLFLQCAQVADQCCFDAIAYEFLTQAFVVYEEHVNDSRQQFASINLIIATINTLANLSQENYETIVTNTSKHAANLLKKPDQCKAVFLCAHLFFPDQTTRPNVQKDEKRVLACLQRSLKIANTCMGQQVHLFVEILNQYLYFYDKQCSTIHVKYLKGLMTLIEEHLKAAEETGDENNNNLKQVKQHYANTLAHIKHKQQQQNEEAQRYRAIDEELPQEASNE